MNRIRQLIAALLICILASCCQITTFADSESTNSLSPKKIVAVLYDDSGSMHISENTNWFYADYALQLFTGLLNPDDELMLTFMSQPGTIIKSNDDGLLQSFSSDRQKTVDAIRNYKGNGNTPFDAIDNVGNALATVNGENPSTQYWFVIIADGSFEKEPGNSKSAASTSELNKKIAKYAGRKMSNGSECQVLFMAIEGNKPADGDNDLAIAFPSESEHVKVEHCNGQGIVDVMSSMADTITGRYRVDKTDIAFGDKEINISSPVPLLNIQVLAQNSDAKVSSASASEGDGLQSSSISMSTPKGDSERKEGKALSGTLSTIQSKGDYIPAGEYAIKFDKDISSDDIVVMYEAALETRLQIFRNGKLIKDSSTLRENETVDLKADLVILGTNESVDISTLPDGVFENMSLSIDENGNSAVNEALGNGNSEIEYKDYVIKNGDTVITARTDLRGFAPLITKELFTAKEPVVYGVKSEGNELSVRRGYINGKKGSVDFTVTGDGKPLSKKDVESLIDKQSISITHDGDKTGVKFRFEITDDGKVHVYPKVSLLNNAWAFFRVPKGEYDVTVSVDKNASATGHFVVNGYPLIGYIVSLIVLLLVALLLYLIKKPHFPNGTMHFAVLKFTKPNFQLVHSEEVELGFTTDFFRIFGPRRVKLPGEMIVYAEEPNKIYISSEWMKAHKSKKEVSGADEYNVTSMDKPGPGTTISAVVLKAFSSPTLIQRSKGDINKNMHFDTIQALGAVDAPGGKRVSAYYFDKR